MIATKPSDLNWQTGPLPPPSNDVVLLVWIEGALANHIEKAFAHNSDGRWHVKYFVPVESIGRVAFWCVLRDEPYPGKPVLLAREDA